MIGIGVSTGGMAMVGLSADPPRGLKAAISFAGGRGSDAPDHVCNPDLLVKTFGDLGRRSKIPMLWMYAANDHFFGPQLAQQLYQAFANNGGPVRFIATGPFGADGHDLFSQQGAPIWTPIVDEFLLGQNLVLKDRPLPDILRRPWNRLPILVATGTETVRSIPVECSSQGLRHIRERRFRL